jgi:serine/threonine protein kinase
MPIFELKILQNFSTQRETKQGTNFFKEKKDKVRPPTLTIEPRLAENSPLPLPLQSPLLLPFQKARLMEFSDEQRICSTPEIEKLFADAGCALNSFTFVPEANTLTPGSQGRVRPVITAHSAQHPLVLKTGGESIKQEIRLLKAIHGIANSEDFAGPLSGVQKILFCQTDELSATHYTRYYEGGDLCQHKTYIQKAYSKENAAVLSYLFTIITQLVETLDFLHSGKFIDEAGKIHVGVVHNDIKPANIFLRKNSITNSVTTSVILADFGCAYFADEAAPQYATIFLAAPELFVRSRQFCIKSLEGAAKSDVWSLGLSLELLLYGQLPSKMTADGYIILNEIQDGLLGMLEMEKWAMNYEKSVQCQFAREAKVYLDGLRNSNATLMASTKATILRKLVLFMQLPDKERPTSGELKEYLKGLAPYFGDYAERKAKSDHFVSELFQRIERSEMKLQDTIVAEKFRMPNSSREFRR